MMWWDVMQSEVHPSCPCLSPKPKSIAQVQTWRHPILDAHDLDMRIDLHDAEHCYHIGYWVKDHDLPHDVTHKRDIALVWPNNLLNGTIDTAKNDLKDQLKEPKSWMMECARRVCVHERVREGNRATVCVSLVVCLMCGFVCVCDCARIECVCVCVCVHEICAQLYICNLSACVIVYCASALQQVYCALCVCKFVSVGVNMWDSCCVVRFSFSHVSVWKSCILVSVLLFVCEICMRCVWMSEWAWHGSVGFVSVSSVSVSVKRQTFESFYYILCVCVCVCVYFFNLVSTSQFQSLAWTKCFSGWSATPPSSIPLPPGLEESLGVESFGVLISLLPQKV